MDWQKKMDWQILGPQLPQTRNWLSRWIGRSVFELLGWQIEGEFPDHPRLIVAVAPHTSNMDFILAIAIIWGLGLRSSYLAKKSLFWFPLGAVMTGLGGIAVDRSSPQGMVEQMTRLFKERPKLVLGITPEGTRSKAGEWKRGFARIAESAQIPILPAVLNYDLKKVHFEPLITTLSNVDDIVSATKQSASIGSPKNKPAS
jgi:1-acyl-sn-glycerol-3-phosphate acyltransferase